MELPNIVIEDHENFSCEIYEYLGLYFDKKLNFEKHINHITVKLAQHSGIRAIVQITGNVERNTTNTRYSIIFITSCSVWRSSIWTGPTNQNAHFFRIPEIVNKDSLQASHQDQHYRKNSKI